MELLVVVAIFFIVAAALSPFIAMVRGRSHRFRCADNLRALSLGLHAYASNHREAFPPTLGELYPEYISSEKAFDCPASKRIGTKDAPDYKYTSGLAESSPPRQTLIEDVEGNHKRSGKNVVRVDGSVDWLSGPR